MAKLAEIKTKLTTASVEDFINKVKPEQKRKDSLVVLEMMMNASGEEPNMWGSSMIGFGVKRYKSPSGREVDWFRLGFSPRKTNLSLHLIKLDAAALKKLGKHKAGTGCIYINKLADIDLKVLKTMIDAAGKRE